MKLRGCLFFTSALLITLSTAAAPLQSTSLDTLKSAVVKLSVRSSNATETAAGVFIGQDPQKAYFLTACHAIIDRCKDSPGGQVQSIRLQFYKAAAQFDAFVFENFDAVADLGVVWTPVKNLPPGLPKIAIKDVVAGVDVRIIGHPSAGAWSVWAGNVQNENGPDVLRFTTTRNNSLADGYSGGAVFDTQGGFLGMHSGTNASYGVEVKSADILRRVRSWNVPTNNVASNATIIPKIDPPVTAANDREAIANVLNRYEGAYNLRDASELWKIWPTADKTTHQNIERSFKEARSISMKVSNISISLAGTHATAKGVCSQEYVPQRNAPIQSRRNDPIAFELEKRDGDWVITSIK